MPASSRRKRVVQSSDSEGGPASHVDTSKKQQDADIGGASSGSESKSKSEIVLSQSAKRRKLEVQPAPQVLGELSDSCSCMDVMEPRSNHDLDCAYWLGRHPAKAKALSNASELPVSGTLKML